MLNDMPAVFDGIIRATVEILCDLRPMVAVDALLLDNDQILTRSPLPTIHGRVEHVMVTLSTLLPGSRSKV